MKVITGIKFITDQGLIVVCDPECLIGIRIYPGEHVLFEGKEYVFVSVVQTFPYTEQPSLLIREPEYRRAIDMNECKCFSTPPGTPFEEGKLYYWQYCIDGIIVFNESGVQWSADGFDFCKYFSPIIQRKKIEAGE